MVEEEGFKLIDAFWMGGPLASGGPLGGEIRYGAVII